MATLISSCRIISLVAAATASFLASGCGLLFFSPETSVSVPPSRLFPSKWLTASTGTAHITISRDADYYRRDLCYERISVDGQDQARIQPGERLDVYLSAGSHVIRARPEGPCQGIASQFEQNIGDGQWLWYRLDASGMERSLYFTPYSGKHATRAVAVTEGVPAPTWRRGGSGYGHW